MGYDRDDLSRLRFVVHDFANNLADPTEVTLRLKRPNGTLEVRTFSAAEITREGVGTYYVILDGEEAGEWGYRWEASGDIELAEPGSIYVKADEFTSPPASATLYATPAQLRTGLRLSVQVLSDDEAIAVLKEACNLVDDRLGVREVNPETGRKVTAADEDAWRVQKLSEATVEVAKVLFDDPGAASRQRARFSSGDVSVSGFYGPAFGELAMSLLNASGLRCNRARMSGSRTRSRLRHFK